MAGTKCEIAPIMVWNSTAKGRSSLGTLQSKGGAFKMQVWILFILRGLHSKQKLGCSKHFLALAKMVSQEKVGTDLLRWGWENWMWAVEQWNTVVGQGFTVHKPRVSPDWVNGRRILDLRHCSIELSSFHMRLDLGENRVLNKELGNSWRVLRLNFTDGLVCKIGPVRLLPLGIMDETQPLPITHWLSRRAFSWAI